MKRKKITDKYSPQELVESFVFRNKLTDAEKEQDAKDIAAARAESKARTSKETILKLRILQIKYQMEDCINKPFDEKYTFAYFLKNYVDALDLKRYEFANEISIDETYLSQLINRHRAPSEEIIIRLEIHSKNFINALTWFKVYEKEKENEIETNKAIRVRQKKFVKETVSL